ncbi:MAG: hypothetical protein HQ478_04345 [Chloroflexi bacterium]|nr:hypothetical protein [Chloroflexota bacterium]
MAKIAEYYLIPVLEALITAFAFTIHGFHTDNEAAKQLNQARNKLFNDMEKPQAPAA